MTGEKDDSLQAISVQLNGQNYSYWSYVLKKFLKGKRMWGYVSGTSEKPKDYKDGKYATEIETWEANNSKIITWINNSVSQSIGVQLAKYETAKEVWDHLKRLYVQSNFAKQYQLEIDIRALQQNNMSIQEFYSAMSNLWDQLAFTESAELQAFKAYTDRREEQRLVQFLMALREDFEGIRGSILHRNPLPTVDSVVNELLAEEIRFKSQSDKGNVDKGILPSPNLSVFAVPSNKGKSYGKVGHDECSFCKNKGHWKAQCPKLLNKPQQTQQPSQWRSPSQFNQRSFKQFRPPTSNTNAVIPPSNESTSLSSPSVADLAEQFQRFLATQPSVMSAMSAQSNIGLSSSSSSGISPSVWILDSGACHHMSSDLKLFVSLYPALSIPIITADGTPLPVAGIGLFPHLLCPFQMFITFLNYA